MSGEKQGRRVGLILGLGDQEDLVVGVRRGHMELSRRHPTRDSLPGRSNAAGQGRRRHGIDPLPPMGTREHSPREVFGPRCARIAARRQLLHAMKADSSSLRPADDLLAQVGWIREVARGMVADASRADDLAQDACVVALETPPRDPRSIRSWLHSVLRNLRRQGGRGELRRRAREAAAARAERLEGADDLLERAEMQRRVVEAVLGLEEPYRSTILWRYFEDQAPREIARRLGVPATTVQSR